MFRPPLFNLVFIAATAAVATVLFASSGMAQSEFTSGVAGIAKQAEGEEKRNVRGDNEAWFFLVRELRQLGLGDFWTQDWETIAANQQDPVPFMAQFNDLLKARGVRLLFVPVPAKGAIYPEHLKAGAAMDDPQSLRGFYDLIEAGGVEVIDAEAAFRELKASNPDEKLYCEQDTHWSPYACEKVSEMIFALVKDEPWVTEAEQQEIRRTEPQVLEIMGDQVEAGMDVDREKLNVRYVGIGGTETRPVAIAPDPDSPVLLLGDSHTLVFWEGSSQGMHCDGAGLLDQLQFLFRFPIDHYGVRGSGSYMARRKLYSYATGKPGYWDKKKLVIWCFSSREFTQSIDRLRDLPIEKAE